MARSGQGYLGLLRRRRGLTQEELAALPGSAAQPDYYPGLTGGPMGLLDRPQAPFSLMPIQTPGAPSWVPTARPVAPTAGPYASLLAKPLPPALAMPQRQAPALAGPQAPDTMGSLLNSADHIPGQLGAAIPQGLMDAAPPMEQTPLDDPFAAQQPLDVGEMPPVEVKDKPYNAWEGMSQFPAYQPPNMPSAQPQPAQTHVNQQDGFGSPTALALLSAGLGILANNTGHYGQAGPAIGKGGMIGLNTFMQLKQQQTAKEQAKAKMAMDQERQKAYMQQVAAQTMGVERQNSADIRKQAIIREMFNYPEDSREFKTLTKRLMMETGQFPQYEKASNPAQQNKPAEIPVNDENGNPITSPDGRVLWKRSVQDPVTKEWKEATFWKGNIVPKPEDAGAKELFKEGAQSIAKENDLQKNRVNALSSLDEADSMLAQGIYSGAGANLKKGGEKLAGAIFGADTSKASRTEQFKSYIGGVIIPNLKALGTQPTDADLRYLESIMAGDVTLEEDTLKGVLASIRKKISREMGQHENTVRQIEKDYRVPNNMRPENQLKPPGGGASRYQDWNIRAQ